MWRQAVNVTALGFLFLGWPLSVWSQCEVTQGTETPAIEELTRDTQAIFETLNNALKKLGELETSDETTKVLSNAVDKDRLIVPGKRVGPFKVGAIVSEITSKLTISLRDVRTEPRYVDILPLGYVPKRDFRSNAKEKLTFAFSPRNGRLLEIIIRNPRFETRDKIHIGTSVADLEKRKGIKKKKGNDGRSYYQELGITFVVDEEKVVEIAVIRVVFDKSRKEKPKDAEPSELPVGFL